MLYFQGMQQLDEAVALWCKVLEQEPNNQNLYTRVGDALCAGNKLVEGRDYYLKALEIGFDQYALLGLANICYRGGDLSNAEAYCLKVLDKFPDHGRTLKLLHAIYEDNGESEKARRIQAQLAD